MALEALYDLKRGQVDVERWLSAAREYAQNEHGAEPGDEEAGTWPEFDEDLNVLTAPSGNPGDPTVGQQFNSQWRTLYRQDYSPREAVDAAYAAVEAPETVVFEPEPEFYEDEEEDWDPDDPQSEAAVHPDEDDEVPAIAAGSEDPDLSAADESGTPGEGPLAEDSDVTLSTAADTPNAVADPEAEARNVTS